MTPHVTCVCVTRPERWPELQRSVVDFSRQTLPGRDLLVVYDERRPAFGVTLRQFAGEHGVAVTLRPAALRRTAEGLLHGLAAARGPVVAVWDDDDLNHPERLEWQLGRTRPGRPTALGESAYLFRDTGDVYLTSHAQAAPASPSDCCRVATLLGWREDLPAVDTLWRGHPAAGLVNSLVRSQAGPDILDGRPCLHLAGVSGGNLRQAAEHRRLAFGLPMSRRREWLLANRTRVEEGLGGLLWDGPVVVSGKDAQAFEFDGPRFPPDLAPFPTRRVESESV